MFLVTSFSHRSGTLLIPLLLKIQHDSSKSRVIGEFQVQVRAPMLKENIENAIHGIAVHLHRRLGERLALHGIDQPVHQTRSSPHGKYDASKRSVRVGKRQMDRADTASINQVDELCKQALALRDWNVLENDKRMY